MSKPRILFLIPTLKGGGAERVLLNLLKNIPDGLYDIELVSMFKWALPDELSHIKYRYMFKRVFRGNIYLLKLLTPKFLFRHFIGDTSDYDIVVSYLHSPTMRIAYGAYGGKTKLVNWIHNEFKSVRELSRLFRGYDEFEKVMRSYDRTIFVADSARESTVKLIPFLENRSQTIYNTVESDVILVKSKEPVDDQAFSDDTFNVISVGRFSKAKAFDRLLRITKAVHDSGRKVHLHLLGQGALYGSYVEEIKRLGIDDMITFPGFVDNPYKYVAKADLFVCSSIHEGFSTAVSESLIVGTPVITTMCSGMEELLGKNGEYGIITPNDEDALKQAVIEIAHDKRRLNDLAYKAKLRGSQFVKEKTVQDVVELFDNLLKNE